MLDKKTALRLSEIVDFDVVVDVIRMDTIRSQQAPKAIAAALSSCEPPSLGSAVAGDCTKIFCETYHVTPEAAKETWGILECCDEYEMRKEAQGMGGCTATSLNDLITAKNIR